MSKFQVPLQYAVDSGGKVDYRASVAGGPVARTNAEYETHQVDMLDARSSSENFTLESNGFCLVEHHSALIDFYHESRVDEVYAAEVKALLKQQTGASRIEVFDHTRRSSSEVVRREKKLREHATAIHNDYTDYSAPKRLRELFPVEADRLQQKRFAIVNVWRPINGQVENHPLAFCDSRSFQIEDLMSVQRKSADRIGEIQFMRFQPNHRWVYFSAMESHEVLLFKTFDSALDSQSRFTPHSSFNDPGASVNAKPRESIETRCFVFYDET